jgi:hypothetical protein
MRARLIRAHQNLAAMPVLWRWRSIEWTSTPMTQ